MCSAIVYRARSVFPIKQRPSTEASSQSWRSHRSRPRARRRNENICESPVEAGGLIGANQSRAVICTANTPAANPRGLFEYDHSRGRLRLREKGLRAANLISCSQLIKSGGLS